MAEHFAQYIFPSVSKTNHKYLDANNDQSTDIGKYLALGAGGNFAGTMLGLGANMMQQENQLTNQKELMNMQNQINLRNAQQAAQIQVHGQQNAGLNPAMAEGGIASAPTVSQGAASMGGMQLANVFDGIANIIAAAKATPEINQIKATTQKTGAETENIETDTGKKAAETTKIGFDIGKIQNETTLLGEQIQNAKNTNEIYESANKFAKDQTGAIMEAAKEKYKAIGAWDKLPEKTKDSWERMINGEITLDKGAMEQFFKTIEIERYMSESDAAIAKSYVDLAVSAEQLKNQDILKSIAELPKNQQDLILTQIKKTEQEATNLIVEKKRIQAEIKRIKQTTKNLKEDNKLIKLEQRNKEIQNEIDDMSDPSRLLYKGEWKKLMAVTGTKTVEKAAEVAAFAAKAKMNPIGTMMEGNMAEVKTTEGPNGTFREIKRYEPVKTAKDYGL